MQPINALIGKALTAMQGQQTTQTITPMSKALKFFAEFKTLGDRQLEQMLQAACAFVDDAKAGKDPRWLSMLGKSGTGKTMLAKTIARALAVGWKSESCTIWHNQPVYYWPTVADRMKAGAWHLVNEIIEPAVVVIDDLGAEHDPSKAIASALCRIMDQRLNKWTVITCNLPLAEIAARIDSRISSRLVRGNNVVVEIDAPDFNLRNQ